MNDTVRDDEAHPLASLMEIVGELIENYENTHYPMPEAEPREALHFLMEEHGLKQSDLAEIGSQGVVSEILAGKRERPPSVFMCRRRCLFEEPK